MRRVRCNPNKNIDIKILFYYSTSFYGVGNLGIFRIIFLVNVYLFLSSFSCFVLAFPTDRSTTIFLLVWFVSGPFRSFFHSILLFYPARKSKVMQGVVTSVWGFLNLK